MMTSLKRLLEKAHMFDFVTCWSHFFLFITYLELHPILADPSVVVGARLSVLATSIFGTLILLARGADCLVSLLLADLFYTLTLSTPPLSFLSLPSSSNHPPTFSFLALFLLHSLLPPLCVIAFPSLTPPPPRSLLLNTSFIFIPLTL